MAANLPALKTGIAFIGAVVSGLTQYVDDNQITSGEVPLIVALVATLVGVYFVPNVRDGENVDTIAQRVQNERKYNR